MLGDRILPHIEGAECVDLLFPFCAVLHPKPHLKGVLFFGFRFPSEEVDSFTLAEGYDCFEGERELSALIDRRACCFNRHGRLVNTY